MGLTEPLALSAPPARRTWQRAETEVSVPAYVDVVVASVLSLDVGQRRRVALPFVIVVHVVVDVGSPEKSDMDNDYDNDCDRDAEALFS